MLPRKMRPERIRERVTCGTPVDASLLRVSRACMR